MGDEHPMGVMADPRELLRALKAVGAIDRMPAPDEAEQMERRTGGRELWRLECAHHLAGAVEAQVLMAGGAAVASALAGVLDAAALESGEHDDPRRGLPQIVGQLRNMADILDAMTPNEHRATA